MIQVNALGSEFIHTEPYSAIEIHNQELIKLLVVLSDPIFRYVNLFCKVSHNACLVREPGLTTNWIEVSLLTLPHCH